MRTESTYRQMELNPAVGDGEMHSPAQVKMQVEQARQQAEFFEQQRDQWETQRRELEQSNEQKALFDANVNEIGMKIHNSVRRLECELESMEREQREVQRVCECFKLHLQILSALQPQNWSTTGFQERLREALPKLDRAENDFHEAYLAGKKYRHTDVFRHKPGEEARDGITWTNIREQMLKGVAFHLPLFLLLLLTWFVYLLVTKL